MVNDNIIKKTEKLFSAFLSWAPISIGVNSAKDLFCAYASISH